jgi:hypothetical protein
MSFNFPDNVARLCSRSMHKVSVPLCGRKLMHHVHPHTHTHTIPLRKREACMPVCAGLKVSFLNLLFAACEKSAIKWWGNFRFFVSLITDGNERRPLSFSHGSRNRPKIRVEVLCIFHFDSCGVFVIYHHKWRPQFYGTFHHIKCCKTLEEKRFNADFCFRISLCVHMHAYNLIPNESEREQDIQTF